MDGTLLDSGRAHVEMFARFWEKHRGSRGEINGSGGPTLWDVFCPAGLDPAEMEEIYRQLDAFYRTDVQDIVARLRFTPPAGPVLSALRAAGVRTALVTNSHAALAAEIVAANGAEALFDAVSGSTFAEQDKQQRLVNTAAAFGVPLGEVLYVGDNESDGRTARQIGVSCAIVLSPMSWLRSPADLLQKVRPTYIVFSLERILDIVL